MNKNPIAVACALLIVSVQKGKILTVSVETSEWIQPFTDNTGKFAIPRGSM